MKNWRRYNILFYGKKSLVISLIVVTLLFLSVVSANSTDSDYVDDSVTNEVHKSSLKSEMGDNIVYVNSNGDSNSDGRSHDNPTTLDNAFGSLSDNANVVFVGDGRDEYSFQSPLTISKYNGKYNDVKNFSLTAEADTIITFKGINSSILSLTGFNVSINGICFTSYSNSSSAVRTSNTNLLLDNCSFIDCYSNTSAGGVYSSSSNVTVANCIFTNDSGYTGGAFYASLSNLSVYSSNFTDNNASFGGAIYSIKSNVTVADCLFDANTAEFGGSLYSKNGSVTVDSSRLDSNTACYYGGAVLSLYDRSISINASNMTENSAVNGGAIYNLASLLNISSCAFESNTALNGSSIYSYNNSLRANDNVFRNSLKVNEVLLLKCVYDLSSNWWSVNSPDFKRLTNGVIPSDWIQVAIQTDEIAYLLSDGREYTGSVSLTTKSVDDKIMVDDEVLTDKVDIYIYTDNITAYKDTPITINITSTQDASGEFTLTLDDYTTTANLSREVCITATPTLANATYYNITLTYNGNSKYNAKNFTSTLKLLGRLDENTTIERISTPQDTVTVSLPERYDLRDYNQTTPAKNQGSSGSCVAFATMSTIESNLLKQHNISYDLSENNLKNLLKMYSVYGTPLLEPNDGGYDAEPIGYLAGWFGPVLEEVDIFNRNSDISALQNVSIHIQDIITVPNRNNTTDNDKIKETIMKYGAVYTGVKLSSSLNQYTTNTYTATHAIAIVGWDDNYSKSNFAGNPPADGAFIIKNSWGESTGDHGYQYVSYYDTVIANPYNTDDQNLLNFAISTENTEQYDDIYQYDTVSYFYRVDNTTVNGSYHYKNIYIARQDETIAAIGTYFTDKSQYNLSLTINNENIYTQNSTINVTGYHTIALNQYFHVEKDDIIEVTITITPENKQSYIIPLHDNDYPSYVDANVSFISFDGITWEDTYTYTETAPSPAPLKMYTRQIPEIKTTATIEDDTLHITTENAEDMTVTYYVDGEVAESSMDISDLNYGSHIITTIVYYDNLKINQKTEFTKKSPKSVTINPVIVDNPVINITINVTGADDETIAKVYLKINGKVLRDDAGKIVYLKVRDDTAVLENYQVPRTWNNQTQIEATLLESSNKTTSEVVNPIIDLEDSPEITIENVTTTAGSTVNITINTRNADGGKIVLKVNGKIIKNPVGKVYITVNGDTVVYTYEVPKTLKNGEYTITATFTLINLKLEETGTLTVV